MTEPALVSVGDLRTDGPQGSGATGRIRRGVAANMAGMGVTVLIQLVSVPVLLSAWGVPTYGEWLVLSAVPTYVALSDFSFSAVAGNSMVMLVAQARHEEAVALGRRLWSIVTVMTCIAVVLAVLVAVLFGGSLGTGAAIPPNEARIVLVALFLQVAVANQYGVLDAWYRAGGRYPLSATFRQVGRLFEFGALVSAVLLGARPGAAATAFLVGSVAGFGVSWIVLRRAVPWATFQPGLPHLSTFRQLLSPGMAFMAFPIGNALSLQGFTIIVGATLGATSVVVFSTTRTVTRLVLQPIWAIGNSIWPELSRSAGGGRSDEARAIVSRATQSSLALALSLALVLAVVGPAIISWWTRGAVAAPRSLLLLLLAVVVCNTFWYVVSMVFVATNRHRRVAAAYLSATTLALFAAVQLTAAFGLIGTALSLLAIDVAMTLLVLRSVPQVIGAAPGEFLRGVLDVRAAVRTALAKARSTT